MARLLRRETANRDLVAQWVWYAETAGIDVADGFLITVEHTLSQLAYHPLSGSQFKTSNAKLAGIRRSPVSGGFESILLFYFPLDDGVELVRVLHGARDIQSLLDPKP